METRALLLKTKGGQVCGYIHKGCLLNTRVHNTSMCCPEVNSAVFLHSVTQIKSEGQRKQMPLQSQSQSVTLPTIKNNGKLSVEYVLLYMCYL